MPEISVSSVPDSHHNEACKSVNNPNGSGLESISIVGQNNCSTFFYFASDCSGSNVGLLVDSTGDTTYDFSDGGTSENFLIITCNGDSGLKSWESVFNTTLRLVQRTIH